MAEAAPAGTSGAALADAQGDDFSVSIADTGAPPAAPQVVDKLPPVFRSRIFRILYRPVVEQPYMFRARATIPGPPCHHFPRRPEPSHSREPAARGALLSASPQDVSDALIDTVACELSVDIFMPQARARPLSLRAFALSTLPFLRLPPALSPRPAPRRASHR